MTNTKTAARKSVPLTAEDIAAAQQLRSAAHGVRAALKGRGVALSPTPSEAEALHALVALGRTVFEQAVEEEGYQRLAAFNATDDEARNWRASRRARAVRRSAAESVAS